MSRDEARTEREISPRRAKQSALALVERRRPRVEHTILQEDIQTCMAMRAEVREAAKKLKKMERYISAALRCGAMIEPGPYTPELAPNQRRVLFSARPRHGLAVVPPSKMKAGRTREPR